MAATVIPIDAFALARKAKPLSGPACVIPFPRPNRQQLVAAVEKSLAAYRASKQLALVFNPVKE